MTNEQKAAIKYIGKLTSGSMEIEMLAGREYLLARRVIIALLTQNVPSKSHCSMEAVDCAIQQTFSLKEMSDVARTENLVKKYRSLTDG